MGITITTTYEGADLDTDAVSRLLGEYRRQVGRMSSVLAEGTSRARGKRQISKMTAAQFRFHRERVFGEFDMIRRIVHSCFREDQIEAIEAAINPEGYTVD